MDNVIDNKDQPCNIEDLMDLQEFGLKLYNRVYNGDLSKIGEILGFPVDFAYDMLSKEAFISLIMTTSEECLNHMQQ